MQVPHVRLYALVLTSALTWDGQGDVLALASGLPGGGPGCIAHAV